MTILCMPECTFLWTKMRIRKCVIHRTLRSFFVLYYGRSLTLCAFCQRTFPIDPLMRLCPSQLGQGLSAWPILRIIFFLISLFTSLEYPHVYFFYVVLPQKLHWSELCYEWAESGDSHGTDAIPAHRGAHNEAEDSPSIGSPLTQWHTHQDQTCRATELKCSNCKTCFELHYLDSK